MLVLLLLFFLLFIIVQLKSENKSNIGKYIIVSLRLTLWLAIFAFFVASLRHFSLLPSFLNMKFWLFSPKTMLVALLVGGVFIFAGHFIISALYKKNKLKAKLPSIMDSIFFYIMNILIFAGLLIIFSAYWGMDHFGELSIDQIIYHLSEPLTGSDHTQIYSFIEGPLVKALFISGCVLEFLNITFHYKITLKKSATHFVKKPHPILRKFGLLSFGVITIFACFALAIQRVGFKEVHAYFFEASKLYETDYKDPEKVQITFPEKKRNLIYIFLESVEASYLSKDVGGSQDNNLMPNLSTLAQTTGTNFSNTDLLGGAQQVPGVGFTAGGMVAQTAGVPVVTTVNGNDYGNTSSYMPGAYSIGEVLGKEGYNQALLIGSVASFGGRDKYFKQHGDYTIMDYNYAIKNNWIPSDYKVWWGYEDQKLFQFAQQTLTDLAAKEEPFNLTMLTADTHFEDGYVTSATPNLFDDQYSNVIHFSDQMLGEFLTWAKAQPFYDNTTIVISGDHLTMDKNFFEDLSPDYTRTVFNLFLNSAVQPATNKNRDFSTLDLYPSTLAAMGATITGDRLGLGTNLFSSTPTLMEKYGVKDFYNQLAQGSLYYKKNIMGNSEQEVIANTPDAE